ncbi:MAG: DUF1015 domain-containing protein [Candidatus Dormiibacterota bacterium]
MSRLLPLRGIHYNPELVRLGGVLAPPYDVISPARREDLYGRDLRNIVRVDFGLAYEDDVAGQRDAYTRAAEHLRSWLEMGILVRDRRPALYLVAHEFAAPDGGSGRRLGLVGRVPALPWERSAVLPHERTLRGPKEDRLALLRATGTQTSPVWLIWKGATGLRGRLEELATGTALIGGRFAGEAGPEKLLLWRLDEEEMLGELGRLLAPAALYVADGHHRFETAAAYAAERRLAGDAEAADSQHVLVYASAADDPALVVLPIHRLVERRPGLPASPEEVGSRLGADWEMEPVVGDPLRSLAQLDGLRGRSHAFVLVAPGGAALLHRPRVETTSARAALDTAVLQDEVIGRFGIGDSELREGALSYTRDPAEAVASVRGGEAGLAFLVSPCTAAEVLAVADSGDTMPQKSTYFYPKVPTGLVLSPV